MEVAFWLVLSVSTLFGIAGLLVCRAATVSWWGPWVAFSGAFVLSGLITLYFVRPWAFVDNYELGYTYDARNGQIRVAPHNGYIARAPFFESVHTIDLRPRQVCINIGNGMGSVINQRVLNCKLVSFNPKGLMLFLSWHGRGDYEDTTLNDLLKIYAYDPSGRRYSFLNVSDETRPVANTTNQPSATPIPAETSRP